jgi:hypothetical protein
MQLFLTGTKINYCVFAVGERGSMRSVTETFREWDFDDEFMARQCRDERLVELQAAGYDCVPRDLYALHNGQRVFVVDARPLVLESNGANELRQPDRSKPKLARANRRTRQRFKHSD